MLSNVPNGPVTNGVMTLAVTSEGGSVTDHGFDKRLSPHVTPDSVTSCVAPDTNGPTPLNAYENGHETQEHYNGSSSTATGAVAEEKSLAAEDTPPKHELNEERTVTNKEDEQTQREETPKRESAEGVPVDKQTETGIPAEEKQATDSSREEVKQPPDSDEGEWTIVDALSIHIWRSVEVSLDSGHVLCKHDTTYANMHVKYTMLSIVHLAPCRWRFLLWNWIIIWKKHSLGVALVTVIYSMFM